MKQSSIDVIIPVYNGMPYVTKTLNSVLHQTLKPNQIIIVNDGSTDNTVPSLQEIAAANPGANIKIINKKNGGHSSATNEGIRNSTADYIALVDADDMWAPQKLEKQMNVFLNSSNPKLGVVYTDYIFIDSNDHELPDLPCTKFDPSVRGDVFKTLVTRGNYITGSNSAVLIKREALLKGGFFDENLRCGEDWDMWISIAREHHYDYSPEALTYIRTHPKNLSSQNMLHCKSNIYIIHKWKKEFTSVGGIALIRDYLARMSLGNLKNIFIKKEFQFLLDQIKDLSNYNYPRLFLAQALGLKIYKKTIKTLQVFFNAKKGHA